MVRPVPWDEMPRHYAPNKKDIAAKVEAKPVEVEVRSFESDLKSIGMRTAFGLVVRTHCNCIQFYCNICQCGSITGGVISTGIYL